jgi:hypothetical protein
MIHDKWTTQKTISGSLKPRRIGGISVAVNDIFENRFADINKFWRDMSIGKYPAC